MAKHTDMCRIVVDGMDYISNDYICILGHPDGDATFIYNTDAVTVGLALKVLNKVYYELLEAMSPEEREEVRKALKSRAGGSDNG